MADPLPEPADVPSDRTADEERERVKAAVAAAADDLRARAAKVSGAAADVLEAQSMMAEDSSLLDDVFERIDGGKTAERAVFEGFAVFRDMLIDLGGYMGERATDLDDVAQRVIAALGGRPAPGVPESDHPFVLVAHDLAPADTALLDLDKVLGLITREGGPTSHTAILAREKAIVAVVGVAGADTHPRRRRGGRGCRDRPDRRAAGRDDPGGRTAPHRGARIGAVRRQGARRAG